MIKKFSIIKRSYIRLGIGAAVLIAAGISFFSNIRLSEEFTGGVNITLTKSVDTKVTADLNSVLLQKGYQNTEIRKQDNQGVTILAIKTNVDNDQKVNELSKEITKTLIDKGYIKSADEISAQSITGPSVGDYMKKSAKNALIVGLLLMAVYMMFSFSAIRSSISPATLAMVTIVTMVFDVGIPAWAYGLLMMFNHSIAIDTVFIIAVLTNMGYSINDTIIIFDRIRENIKNKNEKNIIYGKVFDDSLWQTMRRSIGTVTSTFLVIICMYIFGTGAIKDFAFTIGIWVIAGSYSSIFISGPMAYLLMGKWKSERKAMLENN